MSDPAIGPVDTNVFIHALTTDHLSEECQRFLAAVERGEVQANLEALVLHELSNRLPLYLKQLSRQGVAAYMLTVLGWSGFQGDKELLIDTVTHWTTTSGLGFVDAYLAALATLRSCPVYTKNVRDFAGQGVAVPDPLPDGSLA